MRVFEGRYAPRSPDPRTKPENTVPTTAIRRSTRAKQRGEHQPSKPLVWREKLSRPWSPASTPRFDVSPEQRSWSLNMPLVAITELYSSVVAIQRQAHPPGACHWLQFNARLIRPVGPHPAAQVRRVHSVENEGPRSDSNSCLLPRGATRPTEPATLPPPCKQWVCPAVPV